MRSLAFDDALLPTGLLGTDFKVSKTAHFHFCISRSLSFRGEN